MKKKESERTCQGRSQSSGMTTAPSHAPASVAAGIDASHFQLEHAHTHKTKERLTEKKTETKNVWNTKRVGL